MNIIFDPTYFTEGRHEKPFLPVPIAAALIGGAAGIASTSMANKQSAENAEAANAFTERQWQNKHQWEVADLRKAGLNPILSAHSGGGPASSAMAQAHSPDIAGAAASVASTALQAKRLKEEINLIKSQTRKTDAEANITSWKGSLEKLKSEVVDSFSGVAHSAKRAAHSGVRLGAAVAKNPKKAFITFKNGQSIGYPKKGN